VLDIGAGFGALTRFLGESAASVLAIEPSHRRARGCLARCRDLPNVRAVCTDLNRMPEGLTADVVVAVGVLEYSRMFGRPVPEAPLCFLRELLTHVDEGGTLILAIENQLGLKYLAGAPEDHTSTPFTGVEGRYTASGPVTFGRAKLEDLFSEAGFQWTRFFYPLPDYKMPGCIMSEKAFASRAKVARTLPRLMSARIAASAGPDSCRKNSLGRSWWKTALAPTSPILSWCSPEWTLLLECSRPVRRMLLMVRGAAATPS